MAAEEMREVSIPLEGDTGDTGSVDTGRDDAGDEGGGSEADAAPAPQQPQRQQVRGPDGKFGKPGRGDRRERTEAFRERDRLAGELGSVKQQLAAQAAQYQRDIADIRRAVMEGRQQPAAAPAQAPPSAIDQKIATLKQAIASEVAAARAHDPARGAYDLTRYETLKEQLDEARLEAKLPAILKARGIDLDRRPDPNQRPVDQRQAAQTAADVWRRETMLAEAPWLGKAIAEARTDPQQARILDAFKATAEWLVNAKGRPNGINTDREAAAIVERDFGIAPRRGPARPPRMPIGDQFRGAGDEGDSRTIEVPSSQLENVPPEIAKRVAARMRAQGR